MIVNNNLENLLGSLRKNLKTYLELNDVEFPKNGMVRCINPEHEDRNPSASIGGKVNNEVLHCFGCGASYNIFQAANILEGKPLFGKEFIVNNLFYLADLFGIEHDTIEISEEDLMQMQFYTVTRMVADYVLHAPIPEGVRDFLEKRGINAATHAYSQDIGFIDDYAKYISKVANGNQNILNIMSMAGLDNRTLFSPHNVIFVIKDSNGRPVGFAARNTLYDPNNKSSKKFYNQSSSSDYDIYHKGSRLYGLSETIRDDNYIYIFEGYLDRVIGSILGVKCAAIGGTAFTKDHLITLKENGNTKVVLCYDGDKVGNQYTYKLIDALLEEPVAIDIKLTFLPEGYDPDTYLFEHGVVEFYGLPKLTPFEWRLNSLMNSTDPYTPEEICRIMVPYICLNPSHLHRVELAKVLAANTNVDVSDIKQEIESHLNSKTAIISQGIIETVQKAFREIKKNPDHAVTILNDTMTSVQDIQGGQHDYINEFDEYTDILIQNRLEEDQYNTEKMPGYNYGIFTDFQEAIAGHIKGKMILVPGSPNAGKSSFLANLGLQMAMTNNDVIPFFHTIDDSRRDLQYRMLSILGLHFYDGCTINKMEYYKYYTSRGETELGIARNKAYDILMDLVNQKKLFIKDSSHGTSFGYTVSMIKKIQDSTGKNVALILDNTHNLTDYADLPIREKFIALSNVIKNSTKNLDYTFFGTVEYTKGLAKALAFGMGGHVNELIAETKALEYRADAVIHLHNELHFNPNSKKVHTMADNPEEKLPIVQLAFTKNKISKFKSGLFVKFYPASAACLPIKREEVPNAD